jgi:hypothetical protein
MSFTNILAALGPGCIFCRVRCGRRSGLAQKSGIGLVFGRCLVRIPSEALCPCVSLDSSKCQTERLNMELKYQFCSGYRS